MLKNDTLINGTSCRGLYGSLPPPPTPGSFHSDIIAYIGHLNQDKKFYEDTVVSNLCKFVSLICASLWKINTKNKLKIMLQTFQEFGQSCSCSLANELFSHNIATQSLKGILCLFTFKKTR